MSDTVDLAGQVRVVLERGCAQADLATLEAVVAEDYVSHTPDAGQGPGLAGLKTVVTMFHAAFPDFWMTVQDAMTSGDKVMAMWRGG